MTERKKRGSGFLLSRDTEESPGPLATPCRIWKYGKNAEGYAAMKVGGKVVYLHRWVFEEMVGVLLPGQVINHLCERKACVEPGHLEACWQAENVRWSGRRKR